MSNAEVRVRAQRLLQRVGEDGTLPVDVEFIVEAHFGIEIRLISRFCERYGIVGLLSQDQSSILVDKDLLVNNLARYRFTLAHELGHHELHGELIKAHFEDPSEARLMLWETMSKEDESAAERQANVFAAALLMPRDHLLREFETAIETLSSHGMEFDNLNDFAKMKLIRAMASRFQVSADALRVRLIEEKLISRFENPERSP